VFSRYYNPAGKLRGRDYAIPFEDGRFDFVFLTSVFTHMLPEDMEHYLDEISRVMAPGATCISSFGLTRSAIDAPLHPISPVCGVHDPSEPEHGVVYAEDYVRDCFAARGLRITRLWRGSHATDDPERNPDSQQDLIIAVKD
jgi:SAM-dependent methyltransferase